MVERWVFEIGGFGVLLLWWLNFKNNLVLELLLGIHLSIYS